MWVCELQAHAKMATSMCLPRRVRAEAQRQLVAHRKPAVRHPTPLPTPPQLPATLLTGAFATGSTNVTAPTAARVAVAPASARCPSNDTCAYEWRVTCIDNNGTGVVTTNYTEVSAFGAAYTLSMTTGPSGARVNLGPSVVSPARCTVQVVLSWTDPEDNGTFTTTGTFSITVRA